MPPAAEGERGGGKTKHGWFASLAVAVDVAVGVFLCVVAYRALTATPLTFQNVVLAVVEFLVGCACGLAALVKIDIVDHSYHGLYTYAGKSLFYCVFGVLGLSGDPLKYIFSGLTIAVGLLWLVVGCLWRQTPKPFCDLTSGDARAAPAAVPYATAGGGGGGGGTSGAPKAAALTAGTAAFGDGGASVPSRPDNPFAAAAAGGGGGSSGGGGEAAKPANPFNPFGGFFGGGGGKKAGAAAGGKGGGGSSGAAWS